MDLQACTEGDSSRGGLGGARRAYSGTEALSAEALLHLCCTLSFVLWRCGAALPLVGGGAAECLSRTVALLHCLSQIGLSYLTLAVARAQGVGQAQGCVEGRGGPRLDLAQLVRGTNDRPRPESPRRVLSRVS